MKYLMKCLSYLNWYALKGMNYNCLGQNKLIDKFYVDQKYSFGYQQHIIFKQMYCLFIDHIYWDFFYSSLQLKFSINNMSQISSFEDPTLQHQKQEKDSVPTLKITKKYKQRLYVPGKKMVIWKDGKRKKNSHWTHFEQKRYIKFLHQEGHLLELPLNEKKNQKVNLRMSKKVKTRNAGQCHSHHQKMLQHFQNIQRIIQMHSYLLINEEESFKSKNDEKKAQENEQNMQHNLDGEDFSLNEVNEDLEQQFSSIENHPLDSIWRFLEFGIPLGKDTSNENISLQLQQKGEASQDYKFQSNLMLIGSNIVPTMYEEESQIYLFRHQESWELPYSI